MAQRTKLHLILTSVNLLNKTKTEQYFQHNLRINWNKDTKFYIFCKMESRREREEKKNRENSKKLTNNMIRWYARFKNEGRQNLREGSLQESRHELLKRRTMIKLS
jgi:hypothetical protein